MSEFVFLFYVNDWAGGTQWMTRLQRGGYLDLLLFQVNNTRFSLDDAKRILGDDFDVIWNNIQNKFITDENGFFYNLKMKLVLDARTKFTESRRNNRLGKKKHKNNTSKSLVKLVGKEKEIERIIEEDNIYIEFLNIFKTITGKSKIKSIDNKTKKQLSELLKSYDMKDIALAISNATKDSYHIETEHKYITPEFITRPDKFQKFVSILPKKDEIKQIIPMPKYSKLEIDRVKVVLSDWTDNEQNKYFEDNKHHIELANEIRNGKHE